MAARQCGFDGEIHVFSDIDLPPFNPMLITYYASGKIDYSGLFPFGGGYDFYDQYEAVRHFGSPVVCLDTEKRVVRDAVGRETGYDKCVIASGANPVLPAAFSGVGIEGRVLTLRTVSDALRLKALLASDRKRVLVVGASMVGVKAAEVFAEAGFDVSLADIADSVFPMASHGNCSKMIHKILEGKSIKLLLGGVAGSVEMDAFDHIIVCTGTSPNISFIDPGCIDTGEGVIVNERMETSAEGVYAAGDASQGKVVPGGKTQAVGLYRNARIQGRTAGRNIAGKRAKYAGTVPHNLARFFGHDFVGVGDVWDGDEVYEKTDEANCRYLRLVFKDKALTGANLLNVPEISGILKYHLTKGLFMDGAPDESAGESLALNRLYEKFPDVEKTFAKMK